MSISSRMLLRLEQRIKIKKTGFSVLVSRHFAKTHLKQNLPKLLSNLKIFKVLLKEDVDYPN